jgi:hypothetical protein
VITVFRSKSGFFSNSYKHGKVCKNYLQNVSKYSYFYLSVPYVAMHTDSTDKVKETGVHKDCESVK